MSKKAVQKSSDQIDAVRKLQQQVEELTNNWKRALADYKNLEQRVERQRIETVMYATNALLVKLLEVLDDLERALAHHPQEAWIGLIRDRLRDILTSEGVTEIPVLGQQFDPALMECVTQIVGEKDKVINVLAKGYKVHDQIVRHAKVEVGSGEQEAGNRK